jgi:uncharacterized protein YjbI with pentapeptide repeats
MTMTSRGALGIGLVLLAVLAAELARAACDDPPEAGVDWSKCDKAKLNLSGDNLTGADFSGADLSRSDLRKSQLRSANLSEATLIRTRLDGADLAGADLTKAALDRSNLEDANLTGAVLVKAELPRANLTNVKLVGADLTKAELNRAVLAKADLSGATLVGAYLKRANLRGAILVKASVSDADLDLAELHGSDLSQTIGLVQDQIERACGDTTTKLPPGHQTARHVALYHNRRLSQCAIRASRPETAVSGPYKRNGGRERRARSDRQQCFSDEVFAPYSLSKVILFGERSLRRALSEYVEHFHAERNDRGKGNVLLFPRGRNIRRDRAVQCRERLLHDHPDGHFAPYSIVEYVHAARERPHSPCRSGIPVRTSRRVRIQQD